MSSAAAIRPSDIRHPRPPMMARTSLALAAVLVGMGACQAPEEGAVSQESNLVVHDTATGNADPGGAYFKGALYLAYAGTDGRVNIMRRTGETWSKQVLPQVTNSGAAGVSLAEYHGHLYVAWIERAAPYGLSILRAADGVTWGDKRTVGESHMLTPALVVYGDRLNAFVAVYQSDGHDVPIQQFIFNDNGLEASARAPFVMAAPSGGGISAAVLQNDLFLAWQNYDNTMILRRFVPGQGWRQDWVQTKISVSGTLLSEGGSSLLLIGRGADGVRNGQIFFHRTRDGETFLPLGVATAWTHGRPIGVGNPRVGVVEYAFTGTDGSKSLNVESFNLDPQGSLDAPTNVDIDWVMPKRTYGPRCDGDLLPDTRFVAPSSWPVTLNACMAKAGSAAIDRYEWSIQLGDGTFQKQVTSGCSWSTQVPELGEHLASVTLVTKIGSRATANRIVYLRDHLIVSIGDSYASGEGNAEAYCAFLGPTCLAHWNDNGDDNAEICRRSWKTGPALAAIAAENADPHSSVTFISSACTGHETTNALAPGNQIDRVRRAIGNRSIDALVMSLGGNDMGFGDVIRRCSDPLRDCWSDSDFVNKITAKTNALPGRFDELAAGIKARLAPKRVFITEYPDITRDGNGDYCHVTLNNASGTQEGEFWDWVSFIDGDISPTEMGWAFRAVIGPLNAAVHATTRLGWQVIGGLQRGFLYHGYCAADSWVRNWDQTWAYQGNEFGAFHPNEAGHRFIGERIFEGALKQVIKDPQDHAILFQTPDRFTDRMCPLPCATHCAQNLERCYGPCDRHPGRDTCRRQCEARAEACRTTCN